MSQTDAFPKEKKDAEQSHPFKRLTPDHIITLRAIIAAKRRVQFDTEAISADTESLAERLGVKTGEVSKLVSLIVAEETKGGAITTTERVLNWADQYFGREDNEPAMHATVAVALSKALNGNGADGSRTGSDDNKKGGTKKVTKE